MKNISLPDIIFSLEEFYSIEIYNPVKALHNQITNQELKNVDPSQTIRVIFQINVHLVREIIINKETIRKHYYAVKIIHNENSMNIIMLKNENCLPQIILNKINNILDIKGYIKLKLKIKEFPIINYFLEETNLKNKDFDKIFLLKKKDNNFINQPMIISPFINNNFPISNNINYNNNNQQANNDKQTISNLNQRIRK